MNNPIFTSAAKVVFLALAMTACIAFLYGVLTGKVLFETKDFMLLATAAFSFYFANKGDGGGGTGGTVITNDSYVAPYLGK